MDKDKIRNKNIKGCVICQNLDISKIVDPIIFNAEMAAKDLREKLINQHGLFVEMSEIRAHARHVFIEEFEIPTKCKTELKRINDTSNKELVAEVLSRTNILLQKLIDEGKESTLEFYKLLKEKMSLLSLKAKIDGEISDGVVMVPEWIKKIDDD